MTVQEALNEIDFVWQNMPAQEKRCVQDHWFWAVVVPGLKPEDTINDIDWKDILEHIKWFYPRPQTPTPTPEPAN